MLSQAVADWFLLPAAVSTQADPGMPPTVCGHCGVHHAEPMKLASLFFALQTFSETLGLPQGAPSPAPALAVASPVRALAFQGVRVCFAQAADTSASPVAVVSVRVCACDRPLDAR